MFANSRTVETVLKAEAEWCNRCGADLHDAECIGHERRTKIDIVFEKVVEHVIVTRGETELPAIPLRSNGRRGKIAKSDAHNIIGAAKEP